MTSIIGRLEDWARAGMPTTPERVAWAEHYVREESLAAIRGNFIPSHPREPRPSITLSSHFYCPRQLHLKVSGKDVEDVAPRTYNTWATGRLVEITVVARMILAGLPLLSPIFGTNTQMRLYLDLPAGELRGSLDVVLAAELMDGPACGAEELDRYADAKRPIIICDVKSMAGYGFDRSVADGAVGNTFGYEDQLQNYALAAEQAGLKVSGLWFLIHKKDTGHEAQIPCPRSPGQAAMVNAALLAATSAPLPPRPDWATVKVVKAPGGAVEQIEDVRCGYCACRAACWPGFKQVIVSGKPVHRKPVETNA